MQASEGSLRQLSCLRLQHGWRLPHGVGLGRFAVLQSLTLFHAYSVPEDGSGNGTQVYEVRGSRGLRTPRLHWLWPRALPRTPELSA